MSFRNVQLRSTIYLFEAKTYFVQIHEGLEIHNGLCAVGDIVLLVNPPRIAAAGSADSDDRARAAVSLGRTLGETANKNPDGAGHPRSIASQQRSTRGSTMAKITRDVAPNFFFLRPQTLRWSRRRLRMSRRVSI